MGRPLTSTPIPAMPVATALALAAVLAAACVHKAPAMLAFTGELVTALLAVVQVVLERLLDGDPRGALEALRAV